jgi:hypothetical protein
MTFGVVSCRGRQMRRREFISKPSAGLAAWPLVERAHQSPAPVTRILRSEVSPLAPPPMGSFRLKLRRLGFVGRKNILIKLCFARGGLQQLPMLAVELVRMKMDISLPSGITLRELYNGQRRQSRSSQLATTSLEPGMSRLLSRLVKCGELGGHV